MFFRGFGSGFSACSACGRPAACSCLSLVGLSGHEGVLAAVGSALETDEPAVVDGAVDERGGHVLVAQDAAPSAGLDVGGVDDAPCLVGIGYDLEQEPAAFLVDGHVAELVDDQEPRLPDARELPVEPVLLFGAPQAHEQAGRGEEPDGHCVHACEPSRGDGEMALAGADRAVEHEVLASVDELEGLELGPPPVRRHPEVRPVVAVEGLRVGQPRGFEQAGPFGLLAAGELGLEPGLDEVELGGRGPGDMLGQDAARERQAPAHRHDAFAFGDGFDPAPPGLRDPGIGAPAHRPSSPSSGPSPLMHRS